MPSTKRKALAELSNNTKTRTPQGKESGDRLGKEVLPETDEVPEDQEGGDTFTPDEEFDWDDDDDDPFYYSRSLNEAFPVENGHPNAARYQSRITTLVHKLSRWARNLTSLETIAPSQKLSRSDRETTVEFRVMLANLDPGQLADNSIHHTPMKTQEVLVRVNLNPGDLFDLPNVPRNCTQRLVYLNVVVQVGADNIATKELSIYGKPPVKTSTVTMRQLNADKSLYRFNNQQGRRIPTNRNTRERDPQHNRNCRKC
ncbi:hypothetical protein NOF04DRAFT_1269117 [Fusarium oxysporum II5]|nr:hypothetical protein NOF04DRAFT_1269117 [Fusarium oxysporum II5]